MVDREKVIKGLEKAVEVFDGRISGPMFEMWMDATKDALALLKAQEPMLVTRKDINEIIGDCPNCGQHVIHWHHKFCTNCGQAVKWK